jgi:DNA-binding NarL/FixJ family response regulator
VILSRGVDFGSQESELPFEIYRFEDPTLFPGLGEGVWPDVVLVDLTLLPQSQGAQLPARIGHMNNALAIAVSDDKDNLDCEQIIRMGFVGLLRRDEPSATLIRAVQVVVNGELWFPRQVLSRVLRMLLAEKGKSLLKPREMQILQLIGSGLNNQQIADALFISRETVRWHVRGLYSKLGIKNRRSAREYCRSIHQARQAKPVRSEVRDNSLHSETGR